MLAILLDAEKEKLPVNRYFISQDVTYEINIGLYRVVFQK
jgi:hypothetical protein